MHSRRPLIVLLSLGVILGYGGAIASAAHHHRHGCESRWKQRFEAPVQPAAIPPAPPQTIVVQPPAAAPAPAPQIFVILPGAAAPQAVTPVATPAPSPAPSAP